LPRFFQLPGTIQAEDFRVNNGFQLEDCQDQGGGFNTAFANPGDYVEYLVEVDEPGAFRVEYRVATERTSPKLVFFQEKEGEMVPLDTVTFQSTNGWQEWETQYGQVTLDSGRYKIRLTTLVSEYNLNWFKLSVGASVNNIDHLNDLVLYPNPARARLKVDFPYQGNGNMLFIAYDVAGNVVKSWKRKPGRKFELMLDGFSSGIYILKILEGNRVMSEKFLVSDLN
jgi:endoglucanase